MHGQDATLRATAVQMAPTDGGPVMGDVYTCIAFDSAPSASAALTREFFVGAASGTVHQVRDTPLVPTLPLCCKPHCGDGHCHPTLYYWGLLLFGMTSIAGQTVIIPELA